MLSDRPYMRGDYEREKTSILTWLVAALIAGFVIQLIVNSLWSGLVGRLDQTLGLTVHSVETGRIWTFLTHAFLHSTGFPLHVIFNALALYFLGRELQPIMGTPRFLGVLIVATLIGAVAWTAAHWTNDPAEVHLGATAAVYALFIIFACFFPNQQVTFLLFFVMPVTLKPKHVACALVGFSLLSLLVYEIPDEALPFGMAASSSAHLGGMLVGFLYFRFLHDSSWSLGSPDRPEFELPRWLRRTRRSAPAAELDLPAPTPEPVGVVAAPPPRNIRAEIDRILDKINSQGLGSLTPDERRTLDGGKDLLNRH